MGNMSKVVRQLSKERARLTDELHRVTAALTAFGKVYLSGSNPKGTANAKRTISAAGRQRIAAAQRARWAKQKQGQKPRRTMSASARRKIAAAQRKRWAKVKGQKKAA
jgi:16S rRNA G1207 methylase RsmC